MSKATTVRKADISECRLEAMLAEHAIPRFYWDEVKALVVYGTRPAADLVHRLNYVDNYKRFLKAVLTELSEAYYRAKGIKFPPQGWQPSSRRKAS